MKIEEENCLVALLICLVRFALKSMRLNYARYRGIEFEVISDSRAKNCFSSEWVAQAKNICYNHPWALDQK